MDTERSVRGIAVVALDPQAIRANFRCRGFSRKAAFYTQSLDLPRYRRRGGWDRVASPFTAHPTYMRLQQVHRHVYRLLNPEQRELIASGASVPEAQKLAEQMPETISEKRLQRYLQLLEHMARDGYRQELSPDYMGIAIARDGSAVKVSEGNHRLAAAQLLGLPRIVAEVRYVHESWFRERVKSRRGSAPADIRAVLAELDNLQEVWPP